MLNRKPRDAFGREVATSPKVSPAAASGTYHEEGWLYDLWQVRGAVIMLFVAVACFAALFATYLSRPLAHGHGCLLAGMTLCASGTDSLGFLFPRSPSSVRSSRRSWASTRR